MVAARVNTDGLMPYNQEAERAVLGTIILQNPAIEKAHAVVDVLDFCDEVRR